MDQDNATAGVAGNIDGVSGSFLISSAGAEQPNELDVFNGTVSIVLKSLEFLNVTQAELPALIAQVHKSVAALAFDDGPADAAGQPPVPAVPIKKSVTPDAIFSLEDGKPYKTLKRHLGGLGMTPEQYRAKWGLPVDYPMVAANYAARRSELAKAAGLGQQRRKAA